MDTLDQEEINAIERELAQPTPSIIKFSFIMTSFLMIMVILTLFQIRQIDTTGSDDRFIDGFGEQRDALGGELMLSMAILAISAIYPALLFFWYLDQDKQQKAYLSALVFPLLGLGFVALSWWIAG